MARLIFRRAKKAVDLIALPVERPIMLNLDPADLTTGSYDLDVVARKVGSG